jgi:hypothetical protein
VRFQVNQGWPIGQTLIPAATVIDIGDKPEHELSEFERLARGKIPPLDATALDYDSALTLWRAYPEHRHRLRRNLDDFNEETFQRLLGTDEATLQRHWPRGAG